MREESKSRDLVKFFVDGGESIIPAGTSVDDVLEIARVKLARSHEGKEDPRPKEAEVSQH